jgi:hypothetical protein
MIKFVSSYWYSSSDRCGKPEATNAEIVTRVVSTAEAHICTQDGCITHKFSCTDSLFFDKALAALPDHPGLRFNDQVEAGMQLGSLSKALYGVCVSSSRAVKFQNHPRCGTFRSRRALRRRSR